jgi:hypothetical protein
MNVSLAYHWVALVAALLLGLWLASLLAVRLWTRRQVIKNLLREEEGPREDGFGQPASRPEDQAALDLIRSYRRRYLLKGWPGTALSFKAINEMSLDLIREIAQCYYPGENRPELKASLADLVALHNRVGARLAAWLESRPVRPFKDVELATVVRCHEMYQNVTNHWSYAFIKRHHLDRLASWGWTAFNVVKPWYWGRRAAYEGGKEVGARLLMARVADLVGEEAVRLYGRRRQAPASRKGQAPAAVDPAAAPSARPFAGTGKSGARRAT